MKPIIALLLALWVGIFAISCKQDEINFEQPSQTLRFSEDTISCDTVYKQVRSETYAVKVYNKEDKDVLIPKIRLADGANSPYRINVDGKPGFEFNNVALRKKDSMYIFIEIAPSIATLGRSIAEDKILFETPVATQEVTLISVVQDAEFFLETPTNTNVLSGNITWTKDKAKMIYGNLTLDNGSTLTIEEGTNVYFFKNSGLKIKPNATLKINGDLGKEVIFRGDRNETKYDTIPNNWNGIEMSKNANLEMNYARVFGGVIGIKMYEANANIKNSIIHTFEEFGIQAINSYIAATNSVFSNCGKANIGIFKGGNYFLTHNSISNFIEGGSLGSMLGVYAANDWINENGQVELGSLNLSIRNSILYGKRDNSLELTPSGSAGFNYQLENCLVKYSQPTATYTFDSNPNIINSLNNLDPKFKNTTSGKLYLSVADDSPAKAKGSPSAAALAPKDILKVDRTVSPTIGAYQ